MAAYALIAEPDRVQAQLYRHIAGAEGFEVRLVRDGEEALAVLREAGAPALSIVELSLPRIDGFALIGEIRSRATEPCSPVVAVSAFRLLRETAAQHRERLGISALLSRSAPLAAMRRALRKVLAASQAPHGPAKIGSAPPPAPARLEIDEDRAEEVRLHRLDRMQLRAFEGAEALRALAERTARKFGAQAAMISIVLEDRQWPIAQHGLGGRLLEQNGAPRELSFCTHVVQARHPLVVPDAQGHPAFAENPLVREGSIRGYAGAPLETTSGDVIGALCVLDPAPMFLTSDDVDELTFAARRVAGELELRAEARRQEQAGLPQESSAAPYLSAVLDNIDNGVLLFDPQSRVLLANQALADLFGVTPESLLGKHRDDIVREAAQLAGNAEEFMRKLRTGGEGPYALRGDFEMERPRRRTVRWTAKPVQLREGVGHLAVLTDVTAEMELLREREELARTDPVTGLMNRRAAEEVLEREASRAQRFGSRISLALLDVDHFKQINDRHGHSAGDEALRAVAQAMTSAMRGADVAARWGGDELLAILPATSLEGARSFAERVRATVEQLDPRIMRGATVSAGLAELAPGEDWGDAIRRADDRLYQAKDSGRNRVA